MDWLTVLEIIVGNVIWVLPVWLWVRSKLISDNHELRKILREIQKENKYFHARLIILEERYLKSREKP